MVVLAIVVVACFSAGVWAATTWLPPLGEGAVGTLVYFVVCGLAGAVVALAGLHVWEIVRQLEETSGIRGLGDADIVAAGLDGLLWESGSLAALALVAYLLGPKARETSAAAP